MGPSTSKPLRRILALDGGGIRGVFTLQILARIEELFRKEQNNPGLVLGDVFDLIAGTSTGAIIAAFLSWGKSVKEVEELYVNNSPKMFSKGSWTEQWKAKFKPQAIARFFREEFTDVDKNGSTVPALLGTKRLQDRYLLIVMRNGSTGGAWPVSNNPRARFNARLLEDGSKNPECNLDIPLWQLLRASTAAPTYFPPEEIKLGNTTHLFMDGGMTPYNNPALIAALMATLPPYRFDWPAGREKLHIVSAGTGLARARMPGKAASDFNLLDHIRYIAPALIGSVAWEQDFLCRVMGDCVHGPPLDYEIGALEMPTLLGPGEQKFTYARYDQPLDYTNPKINALPGGQAALDNLALIPLLQEIGKEYAEKHICLEHLYPRTDNFKPCSCSVTSH